jgi:hypothetical protein
MLFSAGLVFLMLALGGLVLLSTRSFSREKLATPVSGEALLPPTLTSMPTPTATPTPTHTPDSPVRENQPPKAIISGPTSGLVGQALNFSEAESSDDGTIVSYIWNFGDGTTDSGKNVTHSYSAVGNYKVTLTVTDDGVGVPMPVPVPILPHIWGALPSIIRTLAKLDARDRRELESLLLSFLEEKDIGQVVRAIRALSSEFDHKHKIDSQIASRLIEIYHNSAARYGDGDALRGTESTEVGLIRELVVSRSDLLSDLVKLAERFDMEDKKRVARLLLEEIERAESDRLLLGALRALHDLQLDSAAIPENTRTRVLALLEHKDWGIADAAFEVGVQYKLI